MRDDSRFAEGDSGSWMTALMLLLVLLVLHLCVLLVLLLVVMVDVRLVAVLVGANVGSASTGACARPGGDSRNNADDDTCNSQHTMREPV